MPPTPGDGASLLAHTAPLEEEAEEEHEEPGGEGTDRGHGPGREVHTRLKDCMYGLLIGDPPPN